MAGYSRKPREEVSSTQAGLPDREHTCRYSMIKGSLAETLVKEMFLSLKYNVFRYGMENTVPGIMQLLRGVKSDVVEHIRRMPDLVIKNPTTSSLFY